MDINSLQWHMHASTQQIAECEDFSIYMGFCSSDELSTDSFDGNYISGTKTLVYSTDKLTVQFDEEWSEIELDAPFFYNGIDNLIIEISWENESHSNYFYVHEWNIGPNRCVNSEDHSEIVSHYALPNMKLIGNLALENSTFASIKVELGN